MNNNPIREERAVIMNINYFENLLGEDLLLEMLEEDPKDERVHIDLFIKENVIQHEIYGHVDFNDKTYYYHAENGVNNGTVFHWFSEHPIYIPRTRTIRVAKIVPLVETSLSLAKAKAMQPKLDEMARKLSYDAYVTGGSDHTTDYWQKEVDKIQGKIVYEEMEIPV